MTLIPFNKAVSSSQFNFGANSAETVQATHLLVNDIGCVQGAVGTSGGGEWFAPRLGYASVVGALGLPVSEVVNS